MWEAEGEDYSTAHRVTYGVTPKGFKLASSRLNSELFLGVYERMTKNDHHGARGVWAKLETLVPLLFKEANPMPIKHCLWRQGLITSPECRLPLTRISPALAEELDRAVTAMA